MNGNSQTQDRFQILPGGPTPRLSRLLLSFFAHLAGLVLVVVPWRAERVRILPQKLDAAREISGKDRLAFKSAGPKLVQPRAIPSHLHSSTKPTSAARGDVTGLETLREHAKQATAGLMMSLKSRSIYGFSPSDYQLAVKTAGEIPTILPADLPPRFQQYVIVEVTIDIDGRVADARITAGMVSPTIEKTLLSAIREFRYNPAKHDGSPIPSQLDIVIHVPT